MSTDSSVQRVVVVEGDASGFAQRITAGAHELTADEPAAAGGSDTGPDPYQLLLAALGSCTSMTVGVYARRKQWPLKSVRVQLTHSKTWAQDCADCERKDARLDRIDQVMTLEGELASEQRQRLLEIAERCPVHRTLTSTISIVTRFSGQPFV
jgi:putative redox protein